MLELKLDPLTPGQRDRLEILRRKQNPRRYDPKPLPLYKELPEQEPYSPPPKEGLNEYVIEF